MDFLCSQKPHYFITSVQITIVKKMKDALSYDDKELKINWMVKNPIISDKDKFGTTI